MSKRIILTGGTGFVGSALYQHLTAAGHRCMSVDIERRGNPGRIPNRAFGYEWLVPNHVGEFDAIVHLAAHATVKECSDDSMGALYNNVAHPVNLVDRLKGQTFIYASTGSLHSKNGVASVYDFTKRTLEQAMGHFYPQAVGLRFGTVCGASPNPRGTMLNQMVEDALRRGVVKASNLHVRRPILGMKDLCRAVERMVVAPISGVHDLCSFNATVEELASEVSAMAGAGGYPVPVEIGPDSPAYDFEMTPAEWSTPLESPGSVIAELIEFYRGRQ